MSDFDSLTWALEQWFDTSLNGLPDAIRQRVERDFFAMPWDSLSADQRRTVAAQLDYQHDPATEQDRQFWWDFAAQQRALEDQVAQWEAVSTPTAGDLAQKETRLAELRHELARMELRKSQVRGDYYPERKRSEDDEAGDADAHSPEDFVHYLRAREILKSRLSATPQEIAMWILHGKNDGGLDGYLRVPLRGKPRKFQFPFDPPAFEYVDSLMQCYFERADLHAFQPRERFLTYTQLLDRLGGRITKPEAIALIAAAGASGDLHGFHPVTGGVRGAGYWKDTEGFPSIEEGMFSLDAVQLIEKKFLPDAPAPTTPLEILPVPTASPPRDSSDSSDQLCESAEDLAEPVRQGADEASVHVTAWQISNRFLVLSDEDRNGEWWKEKMRAAKRYGLAECRVGDGKKGQGGGSLWRPDLVAVWLVDRHTKGREGLSSAAARVALKKFPGCEEVADDLFPPDQ